LNKAVLKRLDKLEVEYGVTPQSVEYKKSADDQRVLFQMTEYTRKRLEMTMTPQEVEEAFKESTNQVVEWYSRFCQLSPEEQKKESERMDKEFEVTVSEDRAWLNSEERKQFDQEYKRWQDDRSHSSGESGNLEAASYV
jgi:hypothetical protein